jgi:hypothetical protein
LGGFWRLWIRYLFDESRADALGLVKALATLWTAATGDLDFPVRVGSISELWFVSGLASGRSTVSTSGIVVVLVVRGRRLTSTRLVFAGRCMWSLMPPKLGSELFVFVFEFINSVLESGDPLKQLFL